MKAAKRIIYAHDRANKVLNMPSWISPCQKLLKDMALELIWMNKEAVSWLSSDRSKACIHSRMAIVCISEMQKRKY